MRSILFAFMQMAVFVAAAQNYALNLNGTNQAVSIGSPIPSASSYTKEAWVYLTTGSGARNIISGNDAPFWVNNGTLNAGNGSNYSQVVDPTAFPTNRWVHVAVTFDAPSTTMRLYRDGTLVSTNTSASAYTSEATYIGSHQGSSSYFQGRIDEVRIWNTALPQAQIKANMYAALNNPSSLLAYYRCDDGTGSTLTDAKGSFNGTILNSAGFVASPVQASASALSFDGTDDVVNIPDNNNLDIASAITIEAWIYATKNSGIQDVVSKSSTTVNTGYIFPRTNDGWATFCIYLHIGGAWRIVSANYPALNAWHHLAATYDGANVRLYLNGNLVNTVALTGAIATNNNILALGNQPGFPENFGGNADEIRIWNVARSQAQIQANMNKQLDPTTQTGLVSYYNFNRGIIGGNNAGLTFLVDQASSNHGTLTNFALTGASSNVVAQNGLITLPVQWESFTALKRQDKALLQWSTSSELNTKEFLLQKSADGQNWEEMAALPAAGNSNSTRSYSYEDAQPYTGANYYRILQVDMDGRMAYSEVKLLQFSAAGRKLFAVQVNPVQNRTIQLRLEASANITVFDSGGKLVWQQQALPGPLNIDLASRPAGVYMVKSGEQVERVVVQ